MAARESYEASIRQHLANRRQAAAIPPRPSPDPLEKQQCQVLGGHLIHWLSEVIAPLLQERAVFSQMEGWDTNPIICFHSSWPGLVAAEEILGQDPGPIVWGVPEDFDSLPDKDEEFKHHVELHSSFVNVAPEELDPELFRKHPVAESETYLVHHDETVLEPLFARGGRHLWKWNGDELILLEEAFESWVS